MNNQYLASYISGKFFEHLNAKVLIAKKNYGKVQLILSDIHKNALNIAHGGVIFSLADMAFAIAANYEEQYAIVNSSSSISYIKKGEEGPLIAEGYTLHKGRKLSVYEVQVMNSDNILIAVATINGHCTNIPIKSLELSYIKANTD